MMNVSRWAGVAAAAVLVAVAVPGVASAAVTWTPQSPPLPSGWSSGDITAISCTSAANCEALLTQQGGLASAEGWNGTNWTAQSFPSYDENSIRAISCASATACMAVGANLSNSEQAYGASWNGSTWSLSPVVGLEDSDLTGVSCPAAKVCFAVGSVTSSDEAVPLAERWNGTTWHTESISAPSGTSLALSSVSCVSASACVAVGNTTASDGTRGITSYTWNGTSWTQQAVPPPSADTYPGLTSVSCPTAANCIAVGNGANDSQNGVFAEYWNGSAWTLQSLPYPHAATSSSVASVSCWRAQCTAVGQYAAGSGMKANDYPLADYYNGTSWKLQATAAPAARKFMTSISCTASRTCAAAGGSIIRSGFEDYRPLVEQEAVTS